MITHLALVMYSYDRYLALFLLGFVGSCLASPLDPIRRQVTGSANPVPASNAIQSSIINQQAYNLCLYEKSLSKDNRACTSFGSSGIVPVQMAETVKPSGRDTVVTFIATYLTAYAGLSAASAVATTNSQGISTTVPVGELGQGKHSSIHKIRLGPTNCYSQYGRSSAHLAMCLIPR